MSVQAPDIAGLPTERALAPLPAAKIAGIAVGALLALVLGAAALFAYSYAGRIVPGVHAAGVDVGGLSPNAAAALLSEKQRLAERTKLDLRADDADWHPSAAEAGVVLDAPELASRAYALGRAGSPPARAAQIVSALLNGADVGGARVDRARIERWVADAAASFDRRPVDATLSVLPLGELRTTPDEVGRQMDRGAAIERIDAALHTWTRAALDGPTPAIPPVAPPLALPHQVLAPTVTAADVAPVLAQARHAVLDPFELRLGDQSRTLRPAERASLLVFGRQNGRPTLDVDAGKLGAFVDRLALDVDKEPVDATLTIDANGVHATPDALGRKLDRAATAERLRAALLAPAGPPASLELVVRDMPSGVRERDLATARADAERALSGPLTIVAGDRTVTLSVEEIAPLLKVARGSDGRTRVLQADEAKLRARVEQIGALADRDAQDARLRVVGGSGKLPAGSVATLPRGGAGARIEAIQEGVVGQRLDRDKAVAALAGGLTSASRRLVLPVERQDAVTSDDRALFGPLELIDAATTSYAGGIPERNHNVELAASRLDGVVVPPGATFSFNKSLGPTTVENGYQISYGILADDPTGATHQTVPSVGGGICQVATTLFQSVFWSGYQIEERHWHFYWIPRYGTAPKGMQGLDATVDEEYNVDLRWTNTTDAPVLIQARTDGGKISFGLYGKKPAWKVDVTSPVIDQVVPKKDDIVKQEDPTLPLGKTLEIEEARDGFRSTIVRTVTMPGVEPRVLKLVSDYQPAENVILVGTKGAAAPAAPTATARP